VRQTKLGPIQDQYIKIRNDAFAEIFCGINSKSLNLDNCREISKGLL
jgi:hypothetical protein